MPSKQEHQKKLIARLRRIEGQLRGIQAMIEKDSSCESIAQQLAAARKALDRAFFEMMACSVEVELGTAKNAAAIANTSAQLARLLAKYG